MHKIERIDIQSQVDCSPDTSYLGYTTDQPPPGSVTDKWAFWREDYESERDVCKGHEYFVHALKDPETAEQDYLRLKDYWDGHWRMYGFYAEAELLVGKDDSFRLTQRIRSAGLWGVESDAGVDYFEHIAGEELEQLEEQLKLLGADMSNFKQLADTAVQQLKEEWG